MNIKAIMRVLKETNGVVAGPKGAAQRSGAEAYHPALLAHEASGNDKERV